jgi:CHAT domain-containing protein/tetratricopeptide (TPR) repeat protein
MGVLSGVLLRPEPTKGVVPSQTDEPGVKLFIDRVKIEGQDQSPREPVRPEVAEGEVHQPKERKSGFEGVKRVKSATADVSTAPPIEAKELTAPGQVPAREAKRAGQSPPPDRKGRMGSGTWKVENDALAQTNAVMGNCCIFFGDPRWADYDYSFEAVKTDGLYGVSALFRASDFKNYMSFDLAGWRNRKYTVECFVNGRHNWVVLDRRGSMAKDKKYRVLVKVRGDHFRCYVDDAPIYDFSDNRHAHGAVGLRCWGAAILVDSIKVTDPDGKMLWEGLPELSAVAAFDPPPKMLTPKERKELVAKWKELNVAGQKHYEAGNLAEATEALETARRLYAKQDHPDLATSLNNLAFVLHHRGRLGDAEPLYREALEMWRRLYPKQDHPDLATSLHNLASVFLEQEKYADAETFCRESLEMQRRLSPKRGSPNLGASLNYLARVLRGRGKYADAEPLDREALEMYRRLYPNRDHPHVALSLHNLAWVLKDRGKYADAEPLFREALEMSRRLYPKQNHHDVAHCLNSLAAVLQDQGKYADSEPLYREAVEMDRRLYRKQDHPLLATSLHNLALVLRDRGEYADAEPLCREALGMRRRLYPKQGHPELATGLDNLAGVLYAQGKYADAEPLYREALEMRRRLYPKQGHPHVALSLNEVATELANRRKYADAEPLYREALEMCRLLYPKQDHPLLATSLHNLAGVLHARGEYADADLLFREALKMYRGLAGGYAAVRSEGDALTLAATYPRTRDVFLSNARSMQADPAAVYLEVWASKSALVRVYEQRALATRTAVADPKAAALLDKLTDRRRRRADLLLASTPTDPTTLKERDADLARYAKDIEELNRGLRPLLPAVDRAEKLAKATPADLQTALAADATVVDFLRYTLFEYDPKKPGKAREKQTASYLAFVVTKDKVAWIDLGPAKPIEDAVAAWREAITGGKDIPPELPAKVRELVWAKVRKEIPDKVNVVYVSPDLALCRVPWAALPGDKPQTILLEDYAVAVIPHAVLLLDKLWPQDPLLNRPAGVLVVGGAAYDADVPAAAPLALSRADLLLKPGQKVGWAVLPGAAAEAKGVAGAAAKKKLESQTLGGKEATRSAVLAALPKARYAHLATHGFFADPSFRSAFQVDPKLFEMTRRGERVGAGALSPLVMTGLAFAGANKPDTPGRGVVTGEALVDLDLSGLDLAVLSACETGLGDVAGGEGTFGLQRAFHLAGTRDVVATLWKVPDRATAALTALFYRNLWGQDMPPAEALRQAQLEIYRNPGKVPGLAAGFRGKFEEVPGAGEAAAEPGPDGKAHPRVWAAFTLSGPGR